MDQNARCNKKVEFPEFLVVSNMLYLFRGPTMVGVYPLDQ